MGERSERGARKSIAVLTLLAALVVAPAIALGPPPTPQIALWGGGDWGTLNNSQKIVNSGDTVTMTASIVGGPPKQGYYCANGNWAVTGTNSVTIYIPSCFQLVDYSPKADGLHTVDVQSYWVNWQAVIPPPHHLTHPSTPGATATTTAGGTRAGRPPARRTSGARA